jgi:polar amino acid transport system substrate-binding protein
MDKPKLYAGINTYLFICTLFLLLTSKAQSDSPSLELASAKQPALTIRAYCEDFNPYSFKENGEITGLSVDLLRAIGKQANIDFKIELVPWKRYLKIVEKTPDTMLFTATRNKNREDRFKWVGPIDGRTQKLFKLKNLSDSWNIEIDSTSNKAALESIHKARYPIIAVSGDASERNLQEQGYNVFSGPKPELNVKQFINERAPFIVNVDISLASKLRMENRSFSEVEAVAIFNDQYSYFYMFNKDTKTEVIYRLQKALDILKYNGIYKDIKAKWLN